MCRGEKERGRWEGVRSAYVQQPNLKAEKEKLTNEINYLKEQLSLLEKKLAKLEGGEKEISE